MAASIQHFDKTGGVVITEKNWADAIAGAVQTAEKFSVQNNGDRALINLVMKIEAVGTGDGSGMLRTGADIVTIIPPHTFAAALTGAGAGGVWASTGVRGYRITATNATGETVGSIEVTVNVDVVTKKVNLSWIAVTGATGYKIYRTDVPGTYTTPALRATIGSGATITYSDDGGAVGAGALPADNTTGGASPNYGTPPALATADIFIAASFAIGQTFIYWVNWVIPGGTPEVGNPRLAQLRFVET
jgi:hypothetical protein